jgi:hypothetical protein
VNVYFVKLDPQLRKKVMTKKKNPQTMLPEEHKEVKIVFAPGCFDSFEGSQEELDELMADIGQMIRSGELFEKAVPLDELDDEELRHFAENIGQADKRNLQ